jgi:hypothetical protein
MSMNVDDLIRKTKTYWYEDGLVEILAGLFFMAIGALLLAEWASPADAPYKWVFAPGFAVVTIVWILSGRKVANWLKERITYPRTGYVAYKRQRPASHLARIVLAAVIGAAVSLVLVASLLYRQEIARVVPLILGVGVALLSFRIGSELGLLRFYAVAAWSVLIGGFLAWLTAEMSLGIALYYGLLGPAFVVTGAATLIRYLRAAPLEESHD